MVGFQIVFTPCGGGLPTPCGGGLPIFSNTLDRLFLLMPKSHETVLYITYNND